jgi:hypothetical protein
VRSASADQREREEKIATKTGEKKIADQIQGFADDLDTPGYQLVPYSVEEMRDCLESILNTVDEELDRR